MTMLRLAPDLNTALEYYVQMIRGRYALPGETHYRLLLDKAGKDPEKRQLLKETIMKTEKMYVVLEEELENPVPPPPGYEPVDLEGQFIDYKPLLQEEAEKLKQKREEELRKKSLG
jgi:hypothetical protein